MTRTDQFDGSYLRLSGIVRAFRAISADMPMQQADILVTIAQSPGLSMNDICVKTHLSQSSVSRNVAALSEFYKLGTPGLGLVEAVNDPREHRRRIVFLTTKGKTFITRLMRNLDPDFSLDRDTDARAEVERMHEEAQAATPKPKTRGKISPLK
ncbi:MAG: MarR family winged helix-turn-helix transcriptional regulator [Pseudomonas sp.]